MKIEGNIVSILHVVLEISKHFLHKMLQEDTFNTVFRFLNAEFLRMGQKELGTKQICY